MHHFMLVFCCRAGIALFGALFGGMIELFLPPFLQLYYYLRQPEQVEVVDRFFRSRQVIVWCCAVALFIGSVTMVGGTVNAMMALIE
eukprot:m.531787 g.531787  ORF g.531787 m.531787 type:complete len:87 (+) comp22040_c1_seq3:2079-2339(+)